MQRLNGSYVEYVCLYEHPAYEDAVWSALRADTFTSTHSRHLLELSQLKQRPYFLNLLLTDTKLETLKKKKNWALAIILPTFALILIYLLTVHFASCGFSLVIHYTINANV